MSAILLSSLLVGLFVLFEGFASSSSSSFDDEAFLASGLSSSSSDAFTIFAVETVGAAFFALRSAISALSAFISFSIASKRSSIVDALASFTSRVAAAKETSSVFLIIKSP